MVNNIVTVKEEIFKNSTTVECKLPVSLVDGESVINLTANSEINSVTVDNGLVTYNGKTVFTLLYIDSGNVKKCEHGVEFSFKVDVNCAKKGDIVRLLLKTVGEKISFANGIASASANIMVTGVVVCQVVTDVQKDLDAFLCKKQEVKSYNEIASVQKTVSIEDEFELNYAVKDVLCHDERVIVKGVEAGIGAINIDGEIEVTAYLNKLDSDEISKERKTIPFSIEIEQSDAYPSCLAYANVVVNTCYLKAFVDEGKNKSDFSIEANLSVTAVLVENATYNVVLDAYSTTNEMVLNKNDVNLVEFLGVINSENQINGDINYEITKNDRLIAVVGVKIEGEEYEYQNNVLKASGVVSATAILYTEQGIKGVELSCPYEVALNVTGNTYLDPSVSIRNFDVRLTPSGFNYSFTVTATCKNLMQKTVKVVSAVEITGEKQVNDSAISVYFAENGETLWDASKVLGVSEEELMRYNDNLVDTFTGEERLVVFREEK